MNEEQLNKIKVLSNAELCLRIQLTKLCLCTSRSEEDGKLEIIFVELVREACERGLMK